MYVCVVLGVQRTQTGSSETYPLTVLEAKSNTKVLTGLCPPPLPAMEVPGKGLFPASPSSRWPRAFLACRCLTPVLPYTVFSLCLHVFSVSKSPPFIKKRQQSHCIRTPPPMTPF